MYVCMYVCTAFTHEEDAAVFVHVCIYVCMYVVHYYTRRFEIIQALALHHPQKAIYLLTYIHTLHTNIYIRRTRGTVKALPLQHLENQYTCSHIYIHIHRYTWRRTTGTLEALPLHHLQSSYIRTHVLQYITHRYATGTAIAPSLTKYMIYKPLTYTHRHT
jgi:hypothetical protein